MSCSPLSGRSSALDPSLIHACQTPRAGEAGFSLAELAVSTAIAAIVLSGAFLIFDVNSRVSRIQLQVSDLQQSQRIAQQEVMRFSRMAGRGGLPQQFALSVNDSVPDGFQVGGNDVVPGTDVLTIRGVFSSPIFLVDPLSNAFTFGGTTGTVRVNSISNAGISQPLGVLEEIVDDDIPEGMLILSPANPTIYAVVEITGGAISPFDVDGDGTVAPGEEQMTLNFSGDPGLSSTNAGYQAMSFNGSVSPLLDTTAYIAIVEEYRFYVREAVIGGGSIEPKLSRARFFPNTNIVYRNQAASAAVDIADHVLDMQLALAIDLNGDRVIDDLSPTAADEWLFNDGSDADTDNFWGANDADAAWINSRLFQLRLTTIVRTDRADQGYQADPLNLIENNDHGESPIAADQDEAFARMHRRRIMQTVIDLRNVS